MGHARTKHSGVEAAFHQYLIGSGLLETEHGVTYKLALKLRQDANLDNNRKLAVELTTMEI
jgi:uncharacterized protein (UPF0332 family)